MFLWSLIVTQVAQLDSLLQNTAALQKLNARFNRAIDDGLDTYCAQMRWQDKNASPPPVLMTFQEMRAEFFPYFEQWIDLLLGQKGISLPVSKHRIVAASIGAAYKAKVDPQTLTERQWTNIVEFVRRPQEIAKNFDCEWPLSKGRWDGKRGYRTQMEAAHVVIRKITNG